MGLFSSIGGLFGGNKVGKRLSKDLKAIAEDTVFQPFNVAGPGSSGIFDGTSATATLSPQLQQSFDLFSKLIGGIGQQAQGFNPVDFSNNYFDSIDRLESRREGDAMASLESRLFNRSGINTGTEMQVRDFRDTLEERRAARAQKAMFDSQNFFTNMLNQMLGLETGRGQLIAGAFDPLKLGSTFGQIGLDAQEIKGNLLKEGAGVRAGTTAKTWEGVGGILDAGVSIFGGGFF